jgi:EmrB/QacA subfamily drug resistance transporter
MTQTGLLIIAAGLILISVVAIPAVSHYIRNYRSSVLKITQSANYKWWVFSTVATGTFMSVVGHGSILIALPTIARHFDAGLTTVLWIAISETLAVSSLLLPMGRVSDILGRKQVYITGYTVFILASAMAGFSTSLTMLLTARVIQGIGSAMVQANGQAMVLSVFPAAERGKALGTQFSVLGVGSMSGMVLGGLLVSTLGWRFVFLINLPVGIIAVFAATIILDKSRFLQDTQGGRRPSFDWLGSLLSAGALLTVLLAMTFGNRIGWGSTPVVAGLAAFMILLAGFIWWELRTPAPMLDLRLFRQKLLAMGIAAGWLSFLGSSGVRFLMAIYLQSVLGYSPRDAGLITLPMAIAMTFVGPFAGRLSDRFGWQKFNVGGSAVAALALFLLAFSLTDSSPVKLIIPLLVLQSVGTGLFGSPNNSSILSTVERSRYGIVSALTSLTRNSANVTSNAFATAIVVSTMASLGAEASFGAVSGDPQAFVSGLNRAFMAAGLAVVVAMVISVLKGDRAKESPDPATQPAARATHSG